MICLYGEEAVRDGADKPPGLRALVGKKAAASGCRE